MLRTLRLSVLATVIGASLAGGQTPVRVSGLAFDSLSGRGLATAFITLGSRSTTADSAGRFTFDSVAPGTYRLGMQHDALDSLGIPGIASSIVVKDRMDEVRITTPSSRTMWRRVCPGEQPRDSGFVFGVVRDARRPIAGATIAARWIELLSVSGTVSQKGWRLDTRTAADGGFVLCGVPVGTGASIEALLPDSTAGVAIEVLLLDKSSVRRYDLTLTSLVDSTARGTIRGTVTSEGRPLSNVHIETDGLPEVITAADGSFILRNVRAGTRQVYVQGIGFAPTNRLVEVAANDTARVSITVGKATVLDSVRVVAPTARAMLADQFNDRRRRGSGYYRDSTQLGKYLSLEGAFSTMASVQIQRPYGAGLVITIGGSRARGTRQQMRGAPAHIFIDRVRSDADHLAALRPSDLAAIEVYRAGEMPMDLATQFGLNPFNRPPAVVAWTKLGWRP